MAVFLLIAQTLVLVAGLALLGQGVVGAFNWRGRHQNLVYRLFETIARPVVKAVRWFTPRLVLDRHIPLATFMLLFCVYFWLGFEHRSTCRSEVVQAGCEKWAAAWSGGGVKQ